MSKLSAHDQQEQLLQETAEIGDYGAPFPRMFRPPYGLWNATTLRLLKKYRMLMILWTVDTNDYEQPGVPAIVHAAVSGARPGAIILMHDAGGNANRDRRGAAEDHLGAQRQGLQAGDRAEAAARQSAAGQPGHLGAAGAGASVGDCLPHRRAAASRRVGGG